MFQLTHLAQKAQHKALSIRAERAPHGILRVNGAMYAPTDMSHSDDTAI